MSTAITSSVTDPSQSLTVAFAGGGHRLDPTIGMARRSPRLVGDAVLSGVLFDRLSHHVVEAVGALGLLELGFEIRVAPGRQLGDLLGQRLALGPLLLDERAAL